VRHAARGVVSMLDRRRQPANLHAMRIFSRVLHYATQHPARPPVELLIRPTFGRRRSTLHYHRWSDMVARGRAAAETHRPALPADGGGSSASCSTSSRYVPSRYTSFGPGKVVLSPAILTFGTVVPTSSTYATFL